MANFYCEPDWHDGQTTDAVVMIQAPEDADPAIMASAFAACEEHAGRALLVMLARWRMVRVREVHNEGRSGDARAGG
jgi:hypothetical protein